MTDETYAATGVGTESGDGAVPDELEALIDTLTALWGDVVATVKKVLEGDLEDVPYADRPEVLIGAAFAGGFLAALILKRLGGR
jgi:hypothetical protein